MSHSRLHSEETVGELLDLQAAKPCGKTKENGRGGTSIGQCLRPALLHAYSSMSVFQSLLPFKVQRNLQGSKKMMDFNDVV